MPTRLLFVCMGNICRSPTAHAVMQSLVNREGLGEQVIIDSAGTGGWHAGDPSDPRMMRHASKRGYALEHRARQVRYADFEEFDLILIMDEQNRRDIRPFAPDAGAMKKVRLLTDYCHEIEADHVPDPYYGGAEGFELVLDIVEDACARLLDEVKARPL